MKSVPGILSVPGTQTTNIRGELLFNGDTAVLAELGIDCSGGFSPMPIRCVTRRNSVVSLNGSH